MTLEDLYNLFLEAPAEIKDIPQIEAYITTYEAWLSYPREDEIFLTSIYKILEELDYFHPAVMTSFLGDITFRDIKLPDVLIEPEWLQQRNLLNPPLVEPIPESILEERRKISIEKTKQLEAEFKKFLKERELRKQRQPQTAVSTATQTQATDNDSNKTELPSLVTQAGTLADSLFRFAGSGFKTVTKEQLEERKRICEGCEFFDPAGFGGVGRCRKCGCSSYKLNMAISACPIGLWKSIQDNPPE